MHLSTFQSKQLALMRQMEAELSAGTPAATTVPMQTDYSSDPQLCLTLNASLPPTITKHIFDRLVTPLTALEPDFYYYPGNTFHITFQTIRKIHFPPQYTPANIIRVGALLAKEVPRHQPFTFELSGVMSLPTSAAIIALENPEYNKFILSLRQQLKDIDVATDQSYYSDTMVFANCTFVRYTHSPSKKFLETLKKLRDVYIGQCTIEEVTLLETNAGVNPQKTKVFGSFNFKPL